MCRSARAVVAARVRSDSRARGVMRMDQLDGWKPGDAGRPAPPNGKTLALLCLKFVKHPDRAKIRQKSLKSLEKRRKNPAPWQFRGWLSRRAGLRWARK